MIKSNSLQNTAALILCIASTPLLAADSPPTSHIPNSFISDKAATSGIQSAWYGDATTRYAHGVLGDAIEAGSLHVRNVAGRTVSIKLDISHVFEDIQPRLADLDGDGKNEIITIRSHDQKGAQIAVYGMSNNTLSLVASTPYIGQAYRWLAPIGIADFDNDGAMDIAYIDRPHLAKILRVWSYRNGQLTQTAQAHGLTNHRIGHDYMTGGVQQCGTQSAMITVNSDWTRLIKTTLNNGKLTAQDIGPYTGITSAKAALSCP